MGATPETEKVAGKQDATLGRGAKAAIWTAVIAAAGTFLTTGVPEIIRLFSSRPALETVQDMIADQADRLTAATNRNVETLKKQQEALQSLDALLAMHREELAKITGCVETVRDVVRDCCTRRVPDVADKLDESKRVVPARLPPEPLRVIVHEKKDEFKKVPQMSRPWQQEQAE